MDSISLENGTGNQLIDNILRGIVGIFEVLFPAQVRGFYLIGSYANRSALPTSDLDLIIVFKTGYMDKGLKTTLWRVCQQSTLICPIRLDLKAYDEAELFHLDAAPGDDLFMTALMHSSAVITKIASLLIYGEDIRDKISLPSIEQFTLDLMYFTSRLFFSIRGEPDFLTFPLDYPDPEDEFYGYTFNDRTEELVYRVGLAATSIIALKARKFVGHKIDCPKVYKACINDEWTSFLEKVIDWCRGKWEYSIPENPQERKQLKEICKQALAFENHFLAIFRDYLLTNLWNPCNKLYAVKRLGEIVHPNRKVLETLQALENREDGRLLAAVKETIRRIQSTQVLNSSSDYESEE